MNRRQFLATAGVTAGIGLTSGCMTMLNGGAENVPPEDQVNSLPQPTLGNPDADVLVQTFEDYQCPHCASFELNHFEPLREDYIEPGHIEFEFYDYPIPVGNNSRTAANVARHVQDEVGEETFWEFKRHLFENQDSIAPNTLVSDAVDHGAEEEAADYAQHGVYDPVIDANKETGNEMGVQGTPYVYVNGERVDNPIYENLANRIDNVADLD